MPNLLLALALLLIVVSAEARAGDGILEINQACAVNTGCFSGDSPGFPVEIIAAGSYRLTSNLSLGGPNESGILVATDRASIDLGGFEIRCFTFVPPSSVEPCSVASGTGYGVEVNSAREGIEVRNGAIVGVGADGILLSTLAVVENVRAHHNGGNGIQVGQESRVFWNSAHDNGNAGIRALNGSVISGNVASGNRYPGISGQSGCLVEGNTTRENGTYGIELNSGAGYRGNVVNNNNDGTVNGGSDLGGNLCNGMTTCP